LFLSKLPPFWVRKKEQHHGHYSSSLHLFYNIILSLDSSPVNQIEDFPKDARNLFFNPDA